jgi:Mn2+/Fe2+ NRAMP family transporter
VITALFVVLLFFGGQCSVVWYAAHQTVNNVLAEYPGRPEDERTLRKVVYILAGVACIIAIGVELIGGGLGTV